MTLVDGESVEISGSGSARYVLKRAGTVLSCSCPAWRGALKGQDLELLAARLAPKPMP